MAQSTVSEQEVAELIERNRQAASALIRGDARGYASLIAHAEDYTLMPPTGGPPRRGFDDSPEALDALGRYFRGGEAEVEVVATSPPATWWSW